MEFNEIPPQQTWGPGAQSSGLQRQSPLEGGWNSPQGFVCVAHGFSLASVCYGIYLPNCFSLARRSYGIYCLTFINNRPCRRPFVQGPEIRA